MAIKLPTKPLPPEKVDPSFIILYGLPKVGKTTIVSVLPDCLLIDLENGSNYVTALKIKANSLKDLQEICKATVDAGKPYKFAAIDTLTKLEEMCEELALQRYLKREPGFKGNVLEIPWGQGYTLLTEAVNDVLDMVNKAFDKILVIAHVKDKVVTSVDGSSEATVKDINTSGNRMSINLSARADATGFIFRDIDGNLCVNFTGGTSTVGGARPAHLAGKEFILAEKQEDGTFTSHWERVYPSLNEK